MYKLNAVETLSPADTFELVVVPRFVASSRVLPESPCALPPCAGDTIEETVLGSYGRPTLANRLAADESRGMIVEYVIQCPMPLPLHILQFLLGHAEIMTEFMYESQANLMTNFCLIGADRLNVLLIKHDVGRTR